MGREYYTRVVGSHERNNTITPPFRSPYRAHRSARSMRSQLGVSAYTYLAPDRWRRPYKSSPSADVACHHRYYPFRVCPCDSWEAKKDFLCKAREALSHSIPSRHHRASHQDASTPGAHTMPRLIPWAIGCAVQPQGTKSRCGACP